MSGRRRSAQTAASSPAIAGTPQPPPLDDIADAEALIARAGSGVNSIKDLAGKKVATPFVSTAHYQLLVAMKLDGIDPKQVNVLNMRPPEIAAAWERGDIDAAFIWDPVLTKIKGNGKVVTPRARSARGAIRPSTASSSSRSGRPRTRPSWWR